MARVADGGWLSRDEQRAWLAYLRATQVVERAIDQDLRTSADLTHPEYEILARLSGAPGLRLRMGVLADGIVVSRSRLSYQIDQLARRGLVRRERHGTDGRGIEAVLTEDGLQLLRAIAPAHVATVRQRLVDRLDPAELATLGAIMTKLVD